MHTQVSVRMLLSVAIALTVANVQLCVCMCEMPAVTSELIIQLQLRVLSVNPIPDCAYCFAIIIHAVQYVHLQNQ